ncbi:MAG: endonuclease/exonuclease/phosphatase family protein [Bacteriovorax sp.]|jgi:endonuclease/exonuclease/phosphatase (EEP) superfamily protein YafD|nr:endonuclease/exonuclease/phosphatase family protein [Bacteriovorax sp.]
MSFQFSSEAKKIIRDSLDFILFCVLSGVLLSFFGRYYWFFNLFDQFWSFYLIFSIFLVLISLYLKKNIQFIFSSLVFIICVCIFYKLKNHSPGTIESSFKVYYHNINSSNSSLDELSKNIKNSNAEIAMLVEATPEIEHVLTHDLGFYVNRYSLARDDNFGFLILSKINFKLEEIHERDGVPVYVKLFFEKYNMKIYLLHLPPPLWEEAWKTQRETLTLIANEINQNKNQSFLILGDLNMTTSSSPFQDFYRKLDSDFYSQDFFLQGTWPSFLPEYFSLPIDHVLSNRNFEMKIGLAAGSDHKSILVRIDGASILGEKKGNR